MKYNQLGSIGLRVSEIGLGTYYSIGSSSNNLSLIADENELLIRVSKGMKRIHIDKTLNPIFEKHIEFEKGRKTRNPNRSNARYSLSKRIAIDSLQTAFALYDLIEQAEANEEKVNNYALAKQVGIEVEQRNTEEQWDIAYKRKRPANPPSHRFALR